MIDGQLNLHSTHFVSKNDYYYDCLHYKVMNDILSIRKTKYFQSSYQIIKYCIRLFENLDKTIGEIEENIEANYTFEQLSKRTITVELLLSWSAPIDLVEQYEIYIDKLDSSLKSEIFYKCKSPWFGVFCQYTFNSDSTFNNIVRDTFDAKLYYPYPDNTGNVLINITNLTCYVHLKCNRGPAPICLDWREICNGQIDCIGSGIYEMNCFELEINQCESNEYQCHNGMCISEVFFRDDLFEPECLDSTDESYCIHNLLGVVGFLSCYLDPSFRCEDAFHPHHQLDFACGDGQQNSLNLFVSIYTVSTVRNGCQMPNRLI